MEVGYFFFSPLFSISNKPLCQNRHRRVVADSSSLATVALKSIPNCIFQPYLWDFLFFPDCYGEFLNHHVLMEGPGTLQKGSLTVHFLQLSNYIKYASLVRTSLKFILTVVLWLQLTKPHYFSFCPSFSVFPVLEGILCSPTSGSSIVSQFWHNSGCELSLCLTFCHPPTPQHDVDLALLWHLSTTVLGSVPFQQKLSLS